LNSLAEIEGVFMDRLQNMTIEKPLVLEDLKDVEWSATADVIVVGQGGAGLCAALEARAHGATVLAIDRFGGGGATAYSGGIFYAGDTRYQKEAGISDSKEEMYKYREIELETAIKPSTLRRYCDSNSADIDWLASHGVPFGGAAYLEKAAYPPEDKFLYYSGNENVAGYREKAMPAPRCHRTVGTGFSGHAYYAALSQAADKAGVERMMHTRAVRLVTDRAGAVIGIEVMRIEDGDSGRPCPLCEAGKSHEAVQCRSCRKSHCAGSGTRGGTWSTSPAPGDARGHSRGRRFHL